MNNSRQAFPHLWNIATAALPRSWKFRAFGLLGVMLLAAAPSPSSCQSSGGGSIGPSGAEVGGAIAGLGAVIAAIVVVTVNHEHHLLKGCVYSDSGVLKLQTSDSKTYTIEGDPAAIKVGDMIKFHGSRVKKTKDSNTGQVFRVDSVKRDYGPCHVAAAHAAGTQ